ncbi:MAG: acyltransferase [Puniceicoccales bacterium]|jgi:peptidoglycan/LPS O-acetylase OafA/YrhL|nr:acyltransferase [Puniceicoccales bacterium]
MSNMLEKTELANTDAPHEAAAKGTGAAEHAQIPALDGLRAIAVTGVILFHIYPPLLPGGFTGVDVFFVLSGLLITSIILHDIKARCFSFKEFYLRRIQRLLPNAIVTLVATLFLLAFFLPAGLEVFTAKHGLWTLFNLSNVYTWVRHGGYWAGTSDWAFLTHFWSLAIEEQYYLLFPFALVIGVHFCFPKIRKFIVLATVLSLGLCLWGSYNRAAATFYLLPTRVWELLLGSALAASGISIYNYSPIVRKLSRVKCELLGWGGCALILASFFFLSGEMKFPGWVVLFPVAGSAFVLFSVMLGESSFSRLLATMPFRGIGRVSYSLYLWHWPLIIFGKLQAELHGYSHITGAVCGGVASIFAGTAAYWCVERPLRRRGVGRGKRLALIGAGFAGAVACCIYLGNRPFRTFPQFDPVTVSGGYYSFRSPQKTKKISFHIPEEITTYDVGYKEPLRKANEAILEGGGLLRLHGGGRVPRVVLSGSSHADMYARVIDEVCLEKGCLWRFLTGQQSRLSN